MTTSVAQSVTIILTLLGLWSFVLTYSTCRMIFRVHKFGRKCRKVDVFQLIASAGFVLFSGAVLNCYPICLSQYVSVLVTICTGTVFTLIHFTEHLLFSCRALNKIKP